MIPVTPSFEAATNSANRSPVQALSVAWDKTVDPAIVFFTIGVSSIGGADIIKGADAVLASIYTYDYTEETDAVISMEVERFFDEPIASFARATLDVVLDNSDERYSPESASLISDYIKINRPFKANLGFDYGAIETLQKFIGLNREFPRISKKNRTATFQALDLAYAIWDTPIEQTELFVDQLGSDIIESLLLDAGVPADQIEMDATEMVIPFAYFEPGETLGSAISKICVASLAVFYVDELGKYRLRARDWYARSASLTPFEITDDMVIEEKDLEDRNVINNIQVNAKPRALQRNQLVFQSSEVIEIPPGETVERFFNYDDPVLEVIQPVSSGESSYYYANTDPANNGIDISSEIDIQSWTDFAKSSKVVFENTGAHYAYITQVRVFARPAKVTEDISIRQVDQDSIDEYGEFKLETTNDFIQTAAQARSFAQIILSDRNEPADYLELTLVAQPKLQLGDTVERRGNTYNISRIYEKLTTGDGYIQKITLVSRVIQTYFRIGISSIEGGDAIAP